MATAKTVEHGGFGTAGVETTVEIKRLNGNESSERVLAFADGGKAIELRMRWTDAGRLRVTYKADPAMLYFQVVKTSGVQISVQDLATDQNVPHASVQP